MNWNPGWSRRTFLSALAAMTGNAFAPGLQQDAHALGKAKKVVAPMLDGQPICPITSGLGPATSMPSWVSRRWSTSTEP